MQWGYIFISIILNDLYRLALEMKELRNYDIGILYTNKQ